MFSFNFDKLKVLYVIFVHYIYLNLTYLSRILIKLGNSIKNETFYLLPSVISDYLFRCMYKVQHSPLFHHICNEKVILLTLPKDNQITPFTYYCNDPTTNTVLHQTLLNEGRLSKIHKIKQDGTPLSAIVVDNSAKIVQWFNG
ncbi:hypothetical protein WUBG_04959 [Wuchereria bancrofti]|uniref:Uncharacterized protein n=1 Tax=Wuchereria bancrofti TaxID=6293 RepID=J9ENR1_WUCBA|nr:hypothetical protein WUBG_04959 [Wuchereria bancrofti]